MKHNFSSNRMWALVVVLLTALWAGVICLSAFPGAMSADSISILVQARSGSFLDSHPPALAFIWRWADAWLPGPQGMLLLNLTAFYGGFAILMAIAALRTGPIAVFMALAFLLNPAILGIIGVIWIDILMAAALMGAVGLLVAAGQMRGKARYFVLAMAFLAICLGIASRHNAAAAAIPLVAHGLFLVASRQTTFLKKSAVFLSSIVVTVLIFISCNLFAASVVQDRQYFWTILAQYDIAGIAVREVDQSITDIFAPATLDDLGTLYTPRSVIPLLVGEQVHSSENPFPQATALPAGQFRDSSDLRDRLAARWINEVAAHPLSYLGHRASVFGSLIGLPPFEVLWAPVFTRIDPNDLGVPPRGDADSPIYRTISRLSSTWVFSPAAYLVLCGLGLLASFWMAAGMHEPWTLLALTLFSSGLLHMMGLFVSAVSSDFRYSYWMIVASTLGAICLALALFVRIAKPTFAAGD